MNGRIHANPAIVFWLIHLSFVIAVPVYALILYISLSPAITAWGMKGLPAPLLLGTLGSLAVIQVILAFTISRWMRPVEPTGDSTDSAENYLRRRMVQMLISDALIEAVAIYGLIGFYLGMTVPQALAFMAVALLLLLARIPQLRHWTEEYGHLGGGRAV